VARDHGARKVLVIGAPAARLAVTKRMCADAVLNPEEFADPAERRTGCATRPTGEARMW
jgi:hypothetical protein